jgi:Uma2 family endonuclease
MGNSAAPLSTRQAFVRAARSSRKPVPMLENGAAMDTPEFLRRYEARPDIKKAELVDGVVYLMASPVRYTQHSKPDGLVQGWMGVYASATPGVEHGTNPTVILGPKDSPQPDGMLCIARKSGGKTAPGADGYLQGPPELVVEIAASSTSLDMHKKLEAYRRAGVAEYLVWCTEDAELHWWRLDDNVYRPLVADKQGIARSRVFPGLVLDVKALLKHDGARVLAALKKGLKSREHAAFVKALRAKGS